MWLSLQGLHSSAITSYMVCKSVLAISAQLKHPGMWWRNRKEWDASQDVILLKGLALFLFSPHLTSTGIILASLENARRSRLKNSDEYYCVYFCVCVCVCVWERERTRGGQSVCALKKEMNIRSAGQLRLSHTNKSMHALTTHTCRHTRTYSTKQTGKGSFLHTPTKISSDFNAVDATYLPLIALPLL